MEYLIIIVSLAGIVLGADWLVAGAVSIARKYRVSDFVIGAAIVGVGTSTPELIVSFMGAVEGNADVAIGNVVGSNIFNILGILGLTALLFPIHVDRDNMTYDIPVCIGVSMLLTLLVFNFFNGTMPAIGRVDGWVMIFLFAAYLGYSFVRDKRENARRKEDQANEERKKVTNPIGWAVVKTVIGLAILVVSCDYFVDNAVLIARSFGVSDAFISLTLIACGTSFPELAASLVAAVRKNTQLALGNIIGSNIFNILFILGVSAQVRPLTSMSITIVDYLVMIAAAIVPLLFGFHGKIGRVGGAFMVIGFVLYTWYLVWMQG